MTSDLVRRPLKETWRWWAALFVPPLVWGARLLAGWTIAEMACHGGWADQPLYFGVQTLLVVLGVVLVVGSAVAAVSAIRAEGQRPQFDTARTYTFLGVSGLLSAVIFGLLIVVEGSAVYLVSCGG